MPRLTFLSCAISSNRRSALGAPPAMVRIRGQTDHCKVALDPLGLGRRNKAALGGERKGKRNSQRHRLAVQQPAGEAGCRFQRVTEGVAEIEQGPFTGLALIARDDRRFHAAAHRDGMLARRRRRQTPPANSPPAKRRNRHPRSSRI